MLILTSLHVGLQTRPASLVLLLHQLLQSCSFCDLDGGANAANTHVCAICRLFPGGGGTIHVNLDALMPEGQPTPSSLHKATLQNARVRHAQALSK